MKRKIIIAAVAALTIIILLFAFGSGKATGGIDSIVIQQQDYQEKVIEAGQLKLAGETTIVAGVTSTVEDITVAEGDLISAGGVLIKLDDSGQSFQVEQNKANYLDARARYSQIVNFDYNAANQELKRLGSVKDQALDSYEDAKILYSEGAISQYELNQAKTSYDTAMSQWITAGLKVAALSSDGAQRASAYEQMQAARALYDNALKEAADYRITVSKESILLKSYVKEGDYVRPGDPLADIGEANSYYVVAEIDEKYFPYVSKGKTKAAVYVGDNRTNAVSGTVTGITPKINKDTGTFELTIGIAKWFPYQASDLSVNIEIMLMEQKQAISIPAQYLSEDNTDMDSQNAAIVYIFENGKAKSRDIKIQRRPSSTVLVTDGLEPGEIIIKPYSGIKDGDAIKLNQ